MTIISFIGETPLNNLLSFWGFRPEREIFIFSPQKVSPYTVDDIKRVLARYSGSSRLIFRPVKSFSVSQLFRVFDELRAVYDDVCFDLNGCDIPLAFSIEKYCISNGLTVFCVDAERNCPVLLSGASLPAYSCPHLTVNEIISAHGAGAMRSGRNAPKEKYFPILKKLIRVILGDLVMWRKQCKFLQRAQALYSSGLNVSCEARLKLTNEVLELNPTFLAKLYDTGALDYASQKNDTVSFKFHDDFIKECLCDIGIWTEMITYIAALESGFFDDVRMSVKIDWDGERNDELYGYAYNEIDGIFVKNYTPYFVSCKTSEPSIEAVNELAVYGRKFGGKNAQFAIVTLAETESSKLINASIIKRCHELDIALVDISDIMSGNMIRKLTHDFR